MSKPNYAAKALASQIINLTHIYQRELDQFIRERDVRGASAREDMWREEVEQACAEALRYPIADVPLVQRCTFIHNGKRCDGPLYQD